MDSQLAMQSQNAGPFEGRGIAFLSRIIDRQEQAHAPQRCSAQDS